MSDLNEEMNATNAPVEDDDLMQPVGDADPAVEPAAAERERPEYEIADLKNQLLRMRAEFENFRRRVAREKEEISDYASMESARGLLAIVDDFERALAVECADSDYAKGMQLIYSRLVDALKKLGAEKIEAEGEAFDPHHHHAIEMVKTAAAPDHTVLQVYQPGYLFKGKLLRPAIVKVAVAPDGPGDLN